MHAATLQDLESVEDMGTFRPVWAWGIVPAFAAITYPFALQGAYIQFAHQDGGFSYLFAVLYLLWCTAIPLIGMYFAYVLPSITQMRRLAYGVVTVPPLYVLLGVLQTMVHSPVSDELVWILLWCMAGTTALFFSLSEDDPLSTVHVAGSQTIKKWRMFHGMVGAVLTVYVLFHLGAHFSAWWGESTWTAFMNAGRSVYRASWLEPILVALFLLQLVAGIRLMWRWGTVNTDGYRVLQVASGVYLSVFLLCHMNSVFLYARMLQAVPTDWDFATGAPAGMLGDAWNIRLFPHYMFGVFFILSHVSSGLRSVLLEHQWNERILNFAWWCAQVISGVIAIVIMVGLARN